MNALPKRSEVELLAVGPYSDYETGRRLVVEQWGDDTFIIGGKPYATQDMRMLAAWSAGGQLEGVAFFKINGSALLLGAVIVTGESRAGVGRVLFEAAAEEGRIAGLKRMRALTTNDNFEAMRFYQRLGMRMETLYPGGADAFRALKTGIYVTGRHGLPIRDIIEFGMEL